MPGPCARLLAGLLLGALLTPAAAADADEVQVPLDRAGRIERVDRPLARRLDLFVERYPRFDEARLFQAADSSFVLEITQVEGRRQTRTRVTLSAAEADSLREVVSTRVRTRAPEASYEQSGRPLLLAGSGVLGLGFYGWALPAAMDVHDGKAFTGTYMVTSAASILVPLLVTQHTDVSFPAADLAIYGGTRGIAHGVLLHDALSSTDERKGAIGTAIAGSLIEGVGLGVWAQANHLSDGAAGSIVTGGDFGLLYGLGLADLTDRLGGEHDGSTAALALGGSGLGIPAGRWLANRRDYTYGDAGVMRTAGLVGGYLGFGTAVALNAEDSKRRTAAAMVGGALGLWVGDALVRGTDLNGGQMIIVDLTTGAGALFGLGAGLLAGSGSDSDEHVVVPASALGAAAGFAVGYSGVRSGARADAGPSRWRLGLEPHLPLAAGAGDRHPDPTLMVTLRYRFD